MATQIFSRMFISNPAATKALAFLLSRSFSATATTIKPSSRSIPALLLNRLRPLSAAARFGSDGIVPGPSARGMSTRVSTASLNDGSPNWSNRPPKETILLDGCDFEHWLVVMEKPEGDPTREEIIDRYIKTLATVFGGRSDRISIDYFYFFFDDVIFLFILFIFLMFCFASELSFFFLVLFPFWSLTFNIFSI